MSNIFQRRNMPFYQFGDMIFLGKIDTASWVDYITGHFADRNRHISPELAQRLCEQVANYSSYVQQLAWLLFSRLNDGDTVTQEQLSQAVNELLDTNEALFMQQVEPLSAYQMNFLRAIAAGHHRGFGEREVREEFNLGSPANITRLKSALINKDLIEVQGRGLLYFTDPVFLLWVQRRMM